MGIGSEYHLSGDLGSYNFYPTVKVTVQDLAKDLLLRAQAKQSLEIATPRRTSGTRDNDVLPTRERLLNLPLVILREVAMIDIYVW